MKFRPFWLLVHRYLGLASTIFLINVGLTGSLLAFYEELDRAINPGWYAEPQSRAALAPEELIERAITLVPQAQIEGIFLGKGAIQFSISPRTNSETNQPFELDYDQLLLDPYTGNELGKRQWGSISQGFVNLMPFVYRLHFSLALQEAGMWVLGISALVWTADCLVGLYLTLPPRRRSISAPGGNSSYFQRWWPAWVIQWRRSPFRLNFTLHRAAGLWLWVALLIYAWSSVYMNLGDAVYSPVMRSISEFHDPSFDFGDLPQPLVTPPISLTASYRIGQRILHQHAREQGFLVESTTGIWLNHAKGFYVFSARTNADFQDQFGSSRVVIDAVTGEERLFLMPTGQYAGNTVTNWLIALHMGNVFGLPYRVFICLLGLVIVMLAVTGVVIWLRKRQARGHRAQAE